jgi:hypothetical protein
MIAVFCELDSENVEDFVGRSIYMTFINGCVRACLRACVRTYRERAEFRDFSQVHGTELQPKILLFNLLKPSGLFTYHQV